MVNIFSSIEGSLDEIIMEIDVAFSLPLALSAGRRESIHF